MTNTCAGCGTELVAVRPKVKPRKWCSERCRKASYGDPCVDCGTRTNYGAESARVAEPRCVTCRRRCNSDRRVGLVLSMLDLRRQGLMNTKISAQLGINVFTVATELKRLRSLGFDVPASPYKNARLRADTPVPDESTYSLCRALMDRNIHVPCPLVKAAA
jgi:hypothetical protein